MNSKKNKRLIASVTNDLVTDNRVHKICTTLSKMGFEVTLVGRKLKNSLPIERPYRTVRMKLLFNKGPFFYAEYNIRLYFTSTVFSQFDILLANDLDTFPANFLVSRVKKKPSGLRQPRIFYRSSGIGESPTDKKNLGIVGSKKCYRKIKIAYTVCESIATIYHEKYDIPFQVVRNLPFAYSPEISADENAIEKIVIYQGSINRPRVGASHTCHEIYAKCKTHYRR